MVIRVACARKDCGAHWDRAERDDCGVCGGRAFEQVAPTLADLDQSIAVAREHLLELEAARLQLQPPVAAWRRMPDPIAWTDVLRYRTYLGNILIAHGWLTTDGETWRHPAESGEAFSDLHAIAREMGKLRAGLRCPRAVR